LNKGVALGFHEVEVGCPTAEVHHDLDDIVRPAGSLEQPTVHVDLVHVGLDPLGQHVLDRIFVGARSPVDGLQ
jgi:hypothetical protein